MLEISCSMIPKTALTLAAFRVVKVIFRHVPVICERFPGKFSEILVRFVRLE